jgi:hypothetical protein
VSIVCCVVSRCKTEPLSMIDKKRTEAPGCLENMLLESPRALCRPIEVDVEGCIHSSFYIGKKYWKDSVVRKVLSRLIG